MILKLFEETPLFGHQRVKPPQHSSPFALPFLDPQQRSDEPARIARRFAKGRDDRLKIGFLDRFRGLCDRKPAQFPLPLLGPLR